MGDGVLMSKPHVNIIVDNPDSWMVPFGKDLANRLSSDGFESKFIVNPVDISSGSYASFFLSCHNKILPPILQKSRYNLVIHASDLPKGKGWSPYIWQILEGKNKIPICLFEVASKIDAGPIYFKGYLDLDGHELLDEIRFKLVDKSYDLILKFLKTNNPKAIPQEGDETFYPKRSSKDSELDLSKSLLDQFNLLRVVDNEAYPAFFSYLGNDYVLKIYKKSSLVNESKNSVVKK
jgi:methionyl-tRNA formyltransferase